MCYTPNIFFNIEMRYSTQVDNIYLTFDALHLRFIKQFNLKKSNNRVVYNVKLY